MAKRARGGNKRVRQLQGLPAQGKKVRQKADAGRSDHLTIAWRLSRFDWEGPWGFEALEGKALDKLVRDWCCQFERQTWAETMRAAGGRRQGNNNHPVQAGRMTRQAQDRHSELRLEEYDTLYSFRIDATTRIYGIRDSRAFEALWLDPWHGQNDKAVYPTQQR